MKNMTSPQLQTIADKDFGEPLNQVINTLTADNTTNDTMNMKLYFIQTTAFSSRPCMNEFLAG